MNKLKRSSKTSEACSCVINRGCEHIFDRIDMGIGFLDKAEKGSQCFKQIIIGVKIVEPTTYNLVGKTIKKSLSDFYFAKEIYWCLVHSTSVQELW